MNFRPVLFAILVALSSSFAVAGEKPPAGGPTAGMPGGSRIMFKQGGIGTMGSMVKDLPSVGIAYLPIDHMQVGLNLALKYDGNQVNKWSSSILVAVEYMLHDEFPFAMGPQLAMMASLAPGSAFSTVVISPAWGFWYAPFNAPIGIGSSLGVDIILNKGLEPVVSLSTPAVRLVYVFN